MADSFVQQASQLWRQGNGGQLAKFAMAHRPTAQPPETENVDMGGLLLIHSRCQWLSSRTNVSELHEAYALREKSIGILLPSGKAGLLTVGSEFLLPLLKRFLLNLRDLALLCDSKDDDGEGGGYQQKCISYLQRLWGTILNDDERNFSCVAIYTVGWQCAHKMNATVVVSRWKLPDGDYKMSETVTYSFWRGLADFGSNKWLSASNNLSFVFENVPPKYLNHRRMVLWRLVPSRLLASLHKEGHKRSVGSAALFQQHRMPELASLTEAFCSGNVGAFEANLRDYEETYVKFEVYIQLLKLRMPLYRNLFKRTYHIIKALRGNAGRVPIADLTVAARAAGWDVDEEEVECVICTLIKDKYIKAKLDPERRSVMFSPSNPFPLKDEKLH
uniref:PCI domain-containing protein n=1 Tax=Hemiselmis andersenii TaxID=464988 RepID=A0A7S1DRJ4_HEMAN